MQIFNTFYPAIFLRHFGYQLSNADWRGEMDNDDVSTSVSLEWIVVLTNLTRILCVSI